MSDLYFISVLGNFNIVLAIAILIFIIILGVGISYFCDNYGLSEESVKENKNFGKRMSRIGAIGLTISIIFKVFIPGKQELYMIYGVGSVIDYCKNNEKIKDLPDKAVLAIDKFLEKYNE